MQAGDMTCALLSTLYTFLQPLQLTAAVEVGRVSLGSQTNQKYTKVQINPGRHWCRVSLSSETAYLLRRGS